MSSSAPRCGPSSFASVSVSGVKPEMSAKQRGARNPVPEGLSARKGLPPTTRQEYGREG